MWDPNPKVFFFYSGLVVVPMNDEESEGSLVPFGAVGGQTPMLHFFKNFIMGSLVWVA
jgi:hypothetical protein